MTAQPTPLLAPVPVGVVLGCVSCQHAYEPTTDDWEIGQTGCPLCGGWTFVARLAEPGGIT